MENIQNIRTLSLSHTQRDRELEGGGKKIDR